MPDMLVKLIRYSRVSAHAIGAPAGDGHVPSDAACRRRNSWRWSGSDSTSASTGFQRSRCGLSRRIHRLHAYLAHRGDQLLLGFACYDTARKNFFGPTGVDEAERGQGIGTALLLAALHAMRDDGYMYGIIGWAGPVGYYEKTVGAAVIPDSEPPGSYRGMLGTRSDLHTRARPADSFLECALSQARLQTLPSLVNDGVDQLGQAASFAHGDIPAEEREDNFAVDGRHLLERRAAASLIEDGAHGHRGQPLRIQHIEVKVERAVLAV